MLEGIRRFGAGTLALIWKGVCESPLRGPAGNVEFLAWWLPGQPGREDGAAMIDACLAVGVK